MNQLQNVFDYEGHQVRTVIIHGEPWFVAKDATNIKEWLPVGSEYCGYIYAIEYGSCIKIGHSRKPHQRINALLSQAKNYAGIELGWFIISKPHTNYMENERLIHTFFKSKRTSGELFSITLEHFLNNLPELRFLDETEDFRKKSEQTTELFKSLLFGTHLK